MIGFFLILSLFLSFVDGEVVDGGISAVSRPEAKCNFSIHEHGPDGKQLSGTSLNTELFYKIKCEKRDGYCLQVSNCTVQGDVKTQKPYPIIDRNGCTFEPSLFEHVQYLDDFTAGIFNPVPIRFRGTKSEVQFECQTTLIPTKGPCERKRCVSNEYSKEANLNH
uniref:ZP domain-containing protein n=1 Tax=Panagrolaimus sp. JU765 TaxID=591449 RepID=A0AC34RTP2_9BILA